MDTLPATRSLSSNPPTHPYSHPQTPQKPPNQPVLPHPFSNQVSTSNRLTVNHTPSTPSQNSPLFTGSSSYYNRKQSNFSITDSTLHSISESTDQQTLEHSLLFCTQNFTAKLLLKIRDLNKNTPKAFDFASAFLALMSCVDSSLPTVSKKISPVYVWSKFIDYLNNPGHVTKMIRQLVFCLRKTDFRKAEVAYLVKQLENCEEIEQSYYQGLNELHKILKLAVRIISQKTEQNGSSEKVQFKSRPASARIGIKKSSPVKPGRKEFARQSQQRERKRVFYQKKQQKLTQERKFAVRKKQNIQKCRKTQEQEDIRQQKVEELNELRRIKALNQELAKRRQEDEYARNRVKSELAQGSRQTEKSLLRDSCKTIISGNTEESYFRNIMRN